MDAESLKQFFSTPFALLLVMVAGALASAFKQMAMARRESGLKISATAYLSNYWPETLIAVGGVIGTFIVMLMTDQLNFASAVFGGWTANSAADVFTPNGRSEALKSPAGTPLDKNNQGGFVRPLMLALLLAIGAVGMVSLPGCASLGIQAKTFPERATLAENGIQAAAESATAAIQGGAIKAEEAKVVSDVLRNAHDALGIAETAYGAGDVTTAEGQLALAESLLRSIRDRLAKE